MTIASPTRPESALDRPVRLRARPDLIALPMRLHGQRTWRLKDPVSLRHFQLREEEYFVWSLLDGQRSLREISELCAERFAPRRLEPAHLQEYLALLHREGLLLSDTPSQGDRLLERSREQRRDAWRSQWMNPLAIRFRGVNPDQFLGWLHARLRWLFHPRMGVLLAFAIMAAAALLTPRWTEFAAQLPSVEGFFQGDNLLWFALALGSVKLVHELGHGLACKHFGAECTELGVMLLVFTPCLYCNVTDAWRLPNPWQRMLISAAGILAELALACLAVLVWRTTEPGFWNALSVRVILVCSVSTLLLNANPLLRYDGYYLLSDWLELPNLHARAAVALRRLTARMLMGVDFGAQRHDPSTDSFGLALFGLTSLVYRVFLVALVAWFFYTAMVRADLPTLAGLLVASTVLIALVKPGKAVYFWATNPTRPSLSELPGRWRLLAITAGIVLLGSIPLPCTVRAPAVLKPRGAVAIYAQAAGALTTTVQEGATVNQGTVLASLRDDTLSRRVQQLAGQLIAQRQHVQNLRRQQLHDPQAAGDLPAAEKTLRAIERQLTEQQSQQELLTIKAPIAGTVIPSPRRSRKLASHELATWSGSPLDPRNQGAYCEAGTLLCYLGHARQLEAIVVIEQGELELVQVGQTVRVRLAGGPAATLSGQVMEISEMNLDAAPEELIAAGALTVRRDADGITRLASPSFQAVVRLDATGLTTWPGMVGRARIDVAAQSLFGRIFRFAAQTFHAPH